MNDADHVIRFDIVENGWPVRDLHIGARHGQLAALPGPGCRPAPLLADRCRASGAFTAPSAASPREPKRATAIVRTNGARISIMDLLLVWLLRRLGPLPLVRQGDESYAELLTIPDPAASFPVKRLGDSPFAAPFELRAALSFPGDSYASVRAESCRGPGHAGNRRDDIFTRVKICHQVPAVWSRFNSLLHSVAAMPFVAACLMCRSDGSVRVSFRCVNPGRLLLLSGRQQILGQEQTCLGCLDALKPSLSLSAALRRTSTEPASPILASAQPATRRVSRSCRRSHPQHPCGIRVLEDAECLDDRHSACRAWARRRELLGRPSLMASAPGRRILADPHQATACRAWASLPCCP